MREWSKQYAAPQQVDVLLFNDFSGLCLANTIEPMRAANTLAGRELFRWRFLTVSGESAIASSGMRVSADCSITGQRGNLLIAMPSYGFLDHARPPVLRALRAASERYDAVAGFDTGSWLLAAAGLLDGYCATIHWEELDRFDEAFPDVNAQRVRHAIDRDRITCCGALAAFELMTTLIGSRHGHALRLEVELLFMHPGSTGQQDWPHAKGRTPTRAIALMQEHTETPLAIAEIARRLGLGRKALERRMRNELGAGPQTVYKRLRLLVARKLALETDLRISEIALRCGYQDPSALTRAFKAEFGATPKQLRAEAGAAPISPEFQDA